LGRERWLDITSRFIEESFIGMEGDGASYLAKEETMDFHGIEGFSWE
jgi:hypothetical protein